MTIYEIKARTEETAPFYFSRKILKFFGQTLRSFSIRKQSDGRYRISAPITIYGRVTGESVRYFNPENNKLERE